MARRKPRQSDKSSSNNSNNNNNNNDSISISDRCTSTKECFTANDLKEAKQALFRAVEQSIYAVTAARNHPKGKRNNDEDEDNSSSNDNNSDHDKTDDLVELFTQQQCGSTCNPKQQKDLLANAVEQFHTAEMRRFLSALLPQIHVIVTSQAFIPDSLNHTASHDHHDNQDKEPSSPSQQETSVPVQADATSSRAMQYLRIATFCLSSYFHAQNIAYVPSKGTSITTTKSSLSCLPLEFMTVVTLLHDILLELHRCGPEGRSTQASIVNLCEAIWLAQVPDCEQIAPQTLSVLLLQAADQGTTARRWTRLFELRHTLTVLDLSDPSCSWIRTTLLRLASDPYCLKHPHGRRFLAFLFQLIPDPDYSDTHPKQGHNQYHREDDNHEDDHDDDETQDEQVQNNTSNRYSHDANPIHPLAADLHQAIKVQVPVAKKSILDTYGDIYWRAWHEAPDENVQRSLEQTVWQDWIHLALYAQQPATVQAIRCLLSPLHENAKTTEEGAQLLYRLYGPVLWRSLRATNAAVRLNAAYCLAAVFPLSTPTRELIAMNQSCDALQALLEDVDDRVREAGTRAVGAILGVYWDAIPSKTLRSLLNTLVTKLASDIASAHVRASVLEAVTDLLAFPATHAVLRPLLPSLGNLIHDKTVRVRAAAVQLLLQIKNMPGLKYYHVVPVHHLLARLASDTSPAITKGLTALVLNSYLPADPRQAVERTVRFAQESPMAAQSFYAHVASLLPGPEVVKLTLLLWKALVSAIAASDTPGPSSLPDSTTSTSAKNGSKRKRVVATVQRRRSPRNSSSNNKNSGSNNNNNSSSNHQQPHGIPTLITELLNGDPSSSYIGLVSSTDVNLWGRLAEIIATLWASLHNQLDQSDYDECRDILLESFSGKVLMGVLQKLQSFSLSADATTAAILRCAGLLPIDAVQDLASYTLQLFHSVEQRSDDSYVHVSAHVALLCLWDKAELVASALALSLTGPDRGLFRKKTESSRECQTPQLPRSVALRILNDLLLGSDPASVAARDCILGSVVARTTLGEALQKGLHRAEILLTDANELSEMPQADVDHVLKLCELYSRFCLHVQVVASDETASSSLHPFAETLLHWTTNTVVPLLTTKQVIFEDSNISRISVDQSFRSPLSPLSPTQGRRSNRNSTPVRLEGGLASASNATMNVVTTHVQHDLAVSLLQSSCLLFSEWLAVGQPGASLIAQASASSWSPAVGFAQDKLLPSVSRLAIQLLRSSHDTSLLLELLVICSEQSETASLRQALVVATASREERDFTLRALSQALDRLATRSEVQPTDELPLSLETVWPYPCGAVGTALSVISSKASLTIAFTKILTETWQVCSLKWRILTVHIVFALLSAMEKIPGKMANLVRSMDAATSDQEGRIVPLLQELHKMIVESK